MFETNCNCKNSIVFKIEADYNADPIWCNKCGFNLDIDDFPISEEIKEELFNWLKKYKLIPAEEHNKLGRYLTEKTRRELGPKYEIIFKPDK
ncbi:hypothetical protein AB1K32_18840 [Metabacillus dongyingensis]|uniref:hypothetical protein n=1 Tax=Metabacillus dongyingensis TaxID=2874282 RepID=UPI003B8ABEFB